MPVKSLSLLALLLLVSLGRNDVVKALLGNLPHRSRICLRAARCSNLLSPPLPLFGSSSGDNKKDEESPQKKNSIGLSGLLQLITAGMGSPFLGDFEGVDKETGKFMFSLEANNLVDEKGESKQVKMPYFESGWVPDEDLEKERKRKEQGISKPWWSLW